MLTRTSSLLLVLALTTASPVASQLADSGRVTGWRSDIDTLLVAIRRQHYVYRAQPLPAGLTRAAAALRAAVPRMSDERMLLELLRLIAFVGDGHSYVLPFGASRVRSTVLPVRFYWFADGLFVIDADSGSERWIGSRVVRIAGTSVDTVLARLDPFVARDNAMGIKWIGPFLLRFRGMIEAVADDVTPGRIRLVLEERGGQSREVSVQTKVSPPFHGLPKLVPSRIPGAPAAPAYLARVADPYWFAERPDVGAVYVQFNQVVDAPTESLRAFAARLERFLAERRPRALIVDVRHNNGGHAELLPPLVETLRRFGGRLYVLTGRNTFSAAQIFIGQVDRMQRATFAGEPSSSRPNFVGEENPVLLPWSGALCSISNRYHETIPGDTRVWIAPAIKVDLASADYFANRDPVMDAVLKDLARPRDPH